MSLRLTVPSSVETSSMSPPSACTSWRASSRVGAISVALIMMLLNYWWRAGW